MSSNARVVGDKSLELKRVAVRQETVVNVLCGLIVAGALGVALWVVFSGRIAEEGVDALFLVIVCLLTAAIFAPMPLQAMRRLPLRGLLHRNKSVGGTKEEPGIAPASAQEGQEESSAAKGA